MLTFVVVLFDGEVARELPNFSGGRYTSTWADRLYRGIRRNFAKDFRFLCLVDRPDHVFAENVEARLLRDPEEGWMCINEVFRPDLGIERGVFMGLDTVIVGDLCDIAAIDVPLALPRDPFAVREPCNALVSFNAETASVLWNAWDSDRARWRKECRLFNRPSEMQFMRRMAHTLDFYYLDDLVPDQLASYKVHVRSKVKSLERARVVYFHGWPKPCDLGPGDPVRAAWEAP